MQPFSASARPAALPPALLKLLPQGKLAPIALVLRRVLLLDRLMELYQQSLALPEDHRSYFEKLLDLLNVRVAMSPEDLDHIPKTGPVVVIANHPFGLVEGIYLTGVIARLRPDSLIMVNSLLGIFAAYVHKFILVNPFGTEEAKRENLQGLRKSVAHLRNGGLLVVFPAGEVAHWCLRKRAIVDPEWSPTVARIVRMGRASVVPMYFSGTNSALFHLLGMAHPRLRTALLAREFFNKQNRTLDVRVGSAIPFSKLAEMDTDETLIGYLRQRTYFLKHRHARAPRRPLRIPTPQILPIKQSPVVAPADRLMMEAEIASLPARRLLDEMGECAVYYATAPEVPSVLSEIGRLREITFRQAGEGTGKAIDIDGFDAHYIHLFIWNREQREVVGAYRLGATDTIRARFGKAGLYTSTLFAFSESFLDRAGCALEMGRSFVRLEYQKSYAPLLLLWKGIGTYVARNPRYKILFGPVSISNEYTSVSRQLMVNYFSLQGSGDELASLIRARSPFKTKPLLENGAERGMRVWNIESLSAMVADIETDQKGIPILLKQYLKLGGRLLGFNLDRDFANALDGLIMVDLTRTDTKMLQRYLGRDGAAAFLDHHGLVTEGVRGMAKPLKELAGEKPGEQVGVSA